MAAEIYSCKIEDSQFLKDTKKYTIEKDGKIYFGGDLFIKAVNEVFDRYIFELSRHYELDMESKINRIEGLVKTFHNLCVLLPINGTYIYEQTFVSAIKKLLMFEAEYKKEKLEYDRKELLRLRRINDILINDINDFEKLDKIRYTVDIINDRPNKKKQELNTNIPLDDDISFIRSTELTETEKEELKEKMKDAIYPKLNIEKENTYSNKRKELAKKLNRVLKETEEEDEDTLLEENDEDVLLEEKDNLTDEEINQIVKNARDDNY